jgi:CheY-like chemotaxis protein
VKRKKVLVVEDDAKQIAALSIRLKSAGFEVLGARDGLEGLKLAVSQKPDLIILDLWMPGNSGCLVAERLKHVGLGHVPVILLTASKKTEVWPIAKEVEPAAFFEKPYNSKQLLEVIHESIAATPALSAQANVKSQNREGTER